MCIYNYNNYYTSHGNRSRKWLMRNMEVINLSALKQPTSNQHGGS